MTYRTCALLLASAALLACNSRDGKETRTIELAYLDPDQALALVEPYVDLEVVRRTSRPAALTITAPSVRIDQIADLLRRYDVPAPGVCLRFQIIEADGFAQTDSSIADVEAVLRGLFRFRGYRAVAEAFATGSAWSHTRHQMVGPRNSMLELSVEIGSVTGSPAAGATGQTDVNRKAAQITVRLIGSTGVVLESSVTVPHGQTVVLGTARPFPDMGALILVVRPEIE